MRAERASGTREVILATAERLFAEHGVYAVSNRQISEAAGQGNNTAVGYHFGSKSELVRAIMRKHNASIELIRTRMVADATGSVELRDWVGCLVRPTSEHLATLASPTWFARFAAQVMADPELRPAIVDDSLTAPALRQVLDELDRCLAELPAAIRAERDDMARHLIVQVAAERERAIAEGRPTLRATWQDTATGLTDAVVGLFRAPVT